MSNEFMREERYIVFKISDIKEALSASEIDDLKYLHRVTNACRERLRKKPLECVVVEKDWPEYEPTWKAIEARVTGAQPALEESAVQTAARIMNVDLIRQCDELRAKIERMERQEPVGTLHDDGCFVWRETAPHQSNYAGWKMVLYALPGAKGE